MSLVTAVKMAAANMHRVRGNGMKQCCRCGWYAHHSTQMVKSGNCGMTLPDGSECPGVFLDHKFRLAKTGQSFGHTNECKAEVSAARVGGDIRCTGLSTRGRRALLQQVTL